MSEPSATSSVAPGRGLRRWTGTAGLLALAIFLAGRVAFEPLRRLPHFAEDSMETHAAVEAFRLQRDDRPIETAVFGSSVTIWGVIPEIIAQETGTEPGGVRKLAMQGGTAFDMWTLVEAHPEKFEHTRLALIEIGPRLLDVDNESGRVELTISQHASLPERLLLERPVDRAAQVADYVLGWNSIRRPLRTVFLNAVDPDPGWPVFPEIDFPLQPAGRWELAGPQHFRPKLDAAKAARILFNDWKPSRLHDASLRRLLAWFRERGTRVMLYQMPVHPDIIAQVRANRDYAEGLAGFRRYVDSLGVAEQSIIRVAGVGEVGISEGAMKDHTHLNRVGAEIYSRHLGAEIRRRLEAKADDADRVEIPSQASMSAAARSSKP